MKLDARRLRPILLCACALAAAAPRAEAVIESGLGGIWMSQTLMSANPPLPMLRSRPGAWRITLQPAWYSGSPGLNDTDAPRYDVDGRFKGLGGGACFSYAFTNDWGAHLWTIGSRSKGDLAVTSKPTCTNCSDSFKFPSVQASYQMASAGATWQAIGGAQGEFAMPVFAGAIVSHTSASQTVRRSSNGSLVDDFDMHIEDITPGLALGAQAGIPVGKSWEINPFLLGALFFTDSCATYTVTRQGVDNGQSSVKSPSCGGPRQLRVGEDAVGAALGINVSYLPWSLSVNITSPFLGNYMAREIYGERATVKLISLSWHYGRS